MLLEINVIEGLYFKDILNQPAALRQTLAQLDDIAALREFARALTGGEYRRVVLTGMGSSLHALYRLHLSLSLAGAPSLLIETAELIHYLPEILDRQSLIIAVSQSGQSIEVIRLLGIIGDRAPLIAVTNNADSPLARRASARVLIQAGRESSVSCKTYVCTLLALEWLRAVLTGEDLAKTPGALSLAAPAVENYLADWKQHVADLTVTLEGIRQIFITGRGSSLSTAGTGGLILKESARFPAEGMSSAAFRHGPLEMLARHVLVVVMAGDDRSKALNRRLAKEVDRAGGRAALVDSGEGRGPFRIPELPDCIRPIVEILPVQMISLALASQAGREAGLFELASKITSVE